MITIPIEIGDIILDSPPAKYQTTSAAVIKSE